MRKSELIRIVESNQNFIITLNHEWQMLRRTDSLLGQCIKIKNLNDVQKWEEFSNVKDACNYMMNKVSYLKRKCKERNIDFSNINIKVEL